MFKAWHEERAAGQVKGVWRERSPTDRRHLPPRAQVGTVVFAIARVKAAWAMAHASNSTWTLLELTASAPPPHPVLPGSTIAACVMRFAVCAQILSRATVLANLLLCSRSNDFVV